jgi:DNA-directed RNA polymerase subunit beta
MENWLGELGYDVYQLISEQSFARRTVLKEWLREKGFDPESLLSFEDVKLSEEERLSHDEQAIAACLNLWLLKLMAFLWMISVKKSIRLF